MDESPFPSGSQDIYARQSHAARDMSNLMDQSLDLRAGSGTTVEDEDDFRSQQGSSTRSAAGPHDVLNKGKGRATGAVDEEDIAGRAAALNLEDGQAKDSAKNDRSQAQQQEHDNDLPTEPPLSVQQRRERALTEERDQLALLNTNLERALHSLEAALPRVERMEQTISTTHELLDTYVRLLSQTEHTQQLVLDPEWEVQKDLDEIAAEEAAALKAQQEEEERIAREAREAEERIQREREEAERKAMMANATTRGRGLTRGVRSARGVPSSRGTTRGTATRGKGTTNSRGTSRMVN